jgi:hypothetical protein
MCDARRKPEACAYRKSREVESVVEGKSLVERKNFQLSCEPQRTNPPPLELKIRDFGSVEEREARGTMRDRYFLFQVRALS